MRIRELIAEGLKTLCQHDVPDAEYDVWQMLSDVTGKEMLSLKLMKDAEVEPEPARQFRLMVSKRADRIPLQYLEGKAWFMGFLFIVTPDVLIPRQDTEILCEEILKRLPENADVLDIGTGSGAIAVSLKKLRPDIHMTAVDISPDALKIARKNAQLNSAEINFLQGDCFSAVRDQKFDVIISNPPYISQEEMDELMPEVCHEPRLALYGGNDGLDFYRRISGEADSHLKQGGLLIYEIGWKEKDAVESILRETIGAPFSVRDLNGNWRVTGAYFTHDNEDVHG